MRRLFVPLILLFALSGCLLTSEQGNQAVQSRPSSGSEGIIGYIVNPANITVVANPDDTMTITASNGTIKTGNQSTTISVYDPIERDIFDFYSSPNQEGRLPAQFLEGTQVARNGSFQLNYRSRPKKYVLLALNQQLLSNGVEIERRDDGKRPMYALFIRTDSGQYKDLATLIREMIDAWVKSFCAKPENANTCEAFRNLANANQPGTGAPEPGRPTRRN